MFAAVTHHLHRLPRWRWSELCAENLIPETTRNTKAVLVVHEVVLHMILLQLFPVGRESLVVEEVMCEIVTNISEYGTTEDICSGRPIVEENHMSESPKRCGKSKKQCRRHHQSQFVHRQIVMNPVKQKMCGQSDSVIRKVSRRESDR